MTNIPYARDRIRDIISYADTPDWIKEDLIDILSFMTRKVPGRKAPIHSRPITPAVVYNVKRMAKINQTMSQQAIANFHEINPGRVSEILAGKYD